MFTCKLHWSKQLECLSGNYPISVENYITKLLITGVTCMFISIVRMSQLVIS